MEGYLQKNPCNNLQEMELCSNSTSPINAGLFAAMASSHDLCLTNDSVPVWTRSFSVSSHGRRHSEGEEASSRVKADGQWSNTLPPFAKKSGPSLIAGDVSSGDGKSNADAGNSEQILCGRNTDPNMDPRKLKRIMSNRVSAQKSRLKKVQYVADMERKLKSLEAHIAVLSPQVELYKNQQHVLQMEQKRLNQKILSCSRNKLLKDAEIEENRTEVNRLRQLQFKQQTEANLEWETTLELQPPLSQSDFGNIVSFHQDNGERTEVGNGPSRFNLTAHHRMVEYKWMPTPGLRQISKPTYNQLGHQGMGRPN